MSDPCPRRLKVLLDFVNQHATLLLIVLLSIVHNVEEAKFVDTFRGRHNAKPVTKLLLLEELLCPVLHNIISIMSP
jgi:hypothetical protein